MARKVGEIDKKTLNRYVSPPTREKSKGTPTPERQEKEVDGFETKKIVPGTVYREPEIQYRTREPVDVYKRHFTQAEIDAALRFLHDCNIRFAQSITPRYDGMPRGDAGPRHGGVKDPYRVEFERLEFVLRRISENDRKTLVPLVVGVRSEQTGQRTQIHDVARNRGVAYRNKEDLAKVGLGLLKAALDHVHEAHREFEQRSRQTSLSSKSRAITRSST